MIPGVICKQYTLSDVMLDNAKLCKFANTSLRLGRAESIDWTTSEITCIDTTIESTFFKSKIIPDLTEFKKFTIPFDYLVIDVGSISKSVDDIKGVKEYTITTRPIAQMIYKLDNFEANSTKTKIDVVIVGAGAAGVELCFTVRQRLRDRIGSVTLLDKSKSFDEILGEQLGFAVNKACEAHSIKVVFDVEVEKVECHSVVTSNQNFPFDLCLWATGASPSPFIQNSGLKTKDGWIEVNSFLQSTSHDNVFAAGDCISLEHGPDLAKSGVFAVREGSILEHNVISWVYRESFKQQMKEYVPQSKFMKILNYGDGTASVDYHGYCFEGILVWYLKDWIDKKFMHSFPMCLVEKNALEVQKVFVGNTGSQNVRLEEESPLLIQKN
jgi:selenide,water dikinase